jgi:hypothetical protein
MATFIIVPLPPVNDKLGETITQKYGNASYCLPNGDWLVAYTGTSKQLSDELGITEGDKGSAIVLNFSGHWGRARKDVWEWIDEYSK